MNPTAPPQPKPSCDRHPEENFTGFCPSCLFERLSVLHPNPSPPSSSSTRKSFSSATALKSIFRPHPPPLIPELRRSKSFSASKNEALNAAFEPQRKSFDVRARGSLWNIFNNSERKIITNKEEDSSQIQIPVEPKEEEEKEENEDEIRVVEEANVSEEIVEEEEEEEEIGEEELKTMKDHIDLDSSSQGKKAKGSFWSAASVFSKKLQKWRQKQKEKEAAKKPPRRRRNGDSPVEEKPTGRKFRDTQSEVADYGFGRRSCDTDPRFSLDAAAVRMSFDGPRYSLDEPRASWDGYLIGGKTGLGLGFPRMPPPPTMMSVVEDAPPDAPVVSVARTDTQIPVEETPIEVVDDDSVPGGCTQTKEYYSDSSSRRRKSFDRSNSVRKRETDELKNVSVISNGNSTSASASSIVGNVNGFNVGNSSKVSPAAGGGVDYMRIGSFHDRGEDCFSETYAANGDRKEGKKSSRRWSIWGFIHRRGRNKDEDEDRDSRVVNGVERCFSEDLRGGFGGGGSVLKRSNSSVSWRNAQGIGGSSFGSGVNGNVKRNNNGNKKGRDEFVLERNRSARYSGSNEVVENNGLLRFYLTPLRGSRRNNGSVKSSSSTGSRSNQAHSIARTVLGLY